MLDVDRIRSRVLIVDDEKAFAEIIAELLADEGYAVRQAYDGLDAMSLLTDRRTAEDPDVVLCDVMLPGLRGDRLAGAVRERFPQRRLPIVLLSAGGDPHVALRDVGFMSKPVDFVDLLGLIERVIPPTAFSRMAAS